MYKVFTKKIKIQGQCHMLKNNLPKGPVTRKTHGKYEISDTYYFKVISKYS